MTIVFAILLFSLLVFLHELGHFVAAKLSGVRVNEFSVFMGPAIVKWQRGETLYAIRCIPFGGYCAMEGEDEDTDDPRSFHKAAWWKRLIILVAGSAMNLLTGFAIYAALYLPADKIILPEITQFTDCCTFQGEDGLQLGDRLLEIDGEKIYTNADISIMLNFNTTGIHDLVVQRDGKIIEFNDMNMTHLHEKEDGTKSTHYGFAFGRAVKATLWDNLGYVVTLVRDDVRLVRLSLQMLLSGKAGFADVSGPVGIVSQMTQVAEQSDTTWLALLNLLSIGAFIANNLAVMNLLPLPALDGGRVFALLLTTGIEAVTRKKINPKYEMYIHGIGMVLLLVLMAVILFKDVFTLFKG